MSANDTAHTGKHLLVKYLEEIGPLTRREKNQNLVLGCHGLQPDRFRHNPSILRVQFLSSCDLMIQGQHFPESHPPK